MQASWTTSPLRHSLVFHRLVRPWKLIPAWFALSLAMPAALAQAPALAVPQAAIASVPPAEEQPNSATPGGPHESVKVHGHWVIEVKNPDGSLAQRREFENALQGSAIKPLVNVLMGSAVAGGWKVYLLGDAAGKDAPCGDGSSCIIQPFFFSRCPSGAGCSTNLKASYNANAGITGFILSGWIQADRSGDVGLVQTWLMDCAGNATGTTAYWFKFTAASPGECGTTYSVDGVKFTEANLPVSSSPLHPCGTQKGENSCEITGIEANQVINVSVNISFQ